MKIYIDLEKEDFITLKHIKCILVNKISKITGEDQSIPTELMKPLHIFEEIEYRIGKTVPLVDFQDELVKNSFKKKESAEIIDSLKKNGLIFEVRQGFLQRI